MGFGLVSGKKGESLFSEPLTRFFRENVIPELLNKTGNVKDDRLLAIVSALIIENRLDHALNSFLPRYGDLTRLNEFTFSMKITLMGALAFVPPRILAVAHLFRRIRNAFAHNLELTKFSELDPKIISTIDSVHADVHRNMGGKQTTSIPMEQFAFLQFFCIVGLDAYSENLSYLRAHIETPEFSEMLFKKSHAENMAQGNAILAKPPVSVELRDGLRFEKYEEGLTNIRAAKDPVDEKDHN